MTDIPIDHDSLVDIQTVKVDKSLSREERIIEFVRQIKNPYLFKCNGRTVRVRYTKGGPTLEECLRRIVD